MRKKQERIAVLISGGLDSAILLGEALGRQKTVYPVYISNGHIWEKTEQSYLKLFLRQIKHKHLKPLTILSMPLGDIYQNAWPVTGKKVPGKKSRDEAVYLPGRNLLLIVKTAVFCAKKKIPQIALAPLKSNPFPDATHSFFNRYASALSSGLGFSIKILAPFISKTKKEVMEMGRKLPLGFTFSCIHPIRNLHCGRCNKCAERKKAFKLIGLKDPTKYLSS